MTFVSCYLCRGREKAYLPGLVVCASSASEGSTSGRQERSSKVYFLYLCVCVFVYLYICVFVYLCICVFVYLCFCVFAFACQTTVKFIFEVLVR